MQQTVTTRIDREIQEELRIRAAILKIPRMHLANQILRDWLDDQPVIMAQKHCHTTPEPLVPTAN